MTRLRYSFLLWLSFALPLAAGPAPQPASLAPLEPAARTEAEAEIQKLCRLAPSSCDEGQDVLAAYFLALDEATVCDLDSCSIEQVRRLNHRLKKLDDREDRLPRPDDSAAGRPLLRLSVLASGRLMRAAVRLNSPGSAILFNDHDRKDAVRDVEAYCLNAPTSCTAARGLLASDARLRGALEACGANECPFETADTIILRAEAHMSEYFSLPKTEEGGAVGLYVLSNATNQRAVSLYTAIVNRALEELRRGAAGLETALDLAEKNPSLPADALASQGPALHESHRQAALGADRLAYHLGYGEDKTKSQTWRLQVNGEAARLAGLRSRTLAVLTARGLNDARQAENGVLADPPRTEPDRTIPFSPPQARSPTLFDSRLVPQPDRAAAAAPPIVAGDPSRLLLAKNMFSDDDLTRADALKRLGLSKMTGDPGRYAAHAFTQHSPVSCAVAAQAQILLAHGLVPGTMTAETLEKNLLEEAKRKSYLHLGTPPEHDGSLLVERGMLVAKYRRTDRATLEAALRRGHVLVAGVDARVLWGQGSGQPLPHSIVVSGAELSSSESEVLGVYINDSGTRPPGAGRFVPWTQFLRAWRGDFVEVL